MRAALERAIMHNKTVTQYEVWEMLSRRQRVDKLKETVSSDAYTQISEFAANLASQFTAVEQEVLEELRNLPFDETEELEKTIASSRNEILLRLIIDGEDYAPLIWKIIEPRTEANVL